MWLTVGFHNDLRISPSWVASKHGDFILELHRHRKEIIEWLLILAKPSYGRR